MGNLLDDLDKRRGQVEITQENRARLSQAYGSVISTGQGTFQFEDPIDFGITFIERPFVSDSHVIDLEALADVLNVDPDLVPIPHSTGTVSHWDQDENDFYIGAWVTVKVSFDLSDLVDFSLSPVIEHHFTFHGIAMKSIPVDLSDSSTD